MKVVWRIALKDVAATIVIGLAGTQLIFKALTTTGHLNANVVMVLSSYVLTTMIKNSLYSLLVP